jgi:hypothetical protein
VLELKKYRNLIDYSVTYFAGLGFPDWFRLILKCGVVKELNIDFSISRDGVHLHIIEVDELGKVK